MQLFGICNVTFPYTTSECPCFTQLIGHGRYRHSLGEGSFKYHPKGAHTVGSKSSTLVGCLGGSARSASDSALESAWSLLRKIPPPLLALKKIIFFFFYYTSLKRNSEVFSKPEFSLLLLNNHSNNHK